MWAEANAYYYRGQLVARLKGGNLYNAPEIIIPKDESGTIIEPEPNGNPLRAVDIDRMVSKNRDVLEIIEDTTVKKIIAIYKKYKDKLDIFHVAFSGGKDSIVLLDLVKKALPHGGFVVVFGDTGMEFPDTYDVIEKTRRECDAEGVAFYVAQSHLSPKDSWELFGPPSKNLRWCCSVHKSAPQVLMLRELTQKVDNKVLAYVGVRGEESINRSKYGYLNYGKKNKGQYDYYPILDWTAAEVFLYIYANNLIFNNAYKLGNSRAGCMVCPMAALKSSYFSYASYPTEEKSYFDIIRKTSDKIFTDEQFKEFMENGAWRTRADGRYLTSANNNYSEQVSKGKLIITLKEPKTDWKAWIKTLGEIIETPKGFTVINNGNHFNFTITENENNLSVMIDESALEKHQTFRKHLKNVFRKAVYCVGCKVCMAQCTYGYLWMNNGKVSISNKCVHCCDCNQLNYGCLRANSLKLPKGGSKVDNKKNASINCYSTHAPKLEWIVSFFSLKEEFFEGHNLGPEQIVRFKRFLNHADLLIGKDLKLSYTANILERIGVGSNAFWGILLVNLSYTPQFRWYIFNIEIDRTISRQELEDRLSLYEQSKTSRAFIMRSFGRILDLPFGKEIGLGAYEMKGKSISSFTRHRWNAPEPRVILYALFKFAEKCNDYKEFTLTTLINDTIDRDGISPTRIFGLDREAMTSMLLGLTAKYPDFINATFTHDMDKIVLSEDKNSTDVLGLFEGG